MDQLQKWSFDPLQHPYPVRLAGLTSPEDFIRDPKNFTAVQKQVEKYVSSIDYPTYRKAAGESLKVESEKAILNAKRHAGTIKELTDEDPKSEDEILSVAYGETITKNENLTAERKSFVKSTKANVAKALERIVDKPDRKEDFIDDYHDHGTNEDAHALNKIAHQYLTQISRNENNPHRELAAELLSAMKEKRNG